MNLSHILQCTTADRSQSQWEIRKRLHEAIPIEIDELADNYLHLFHTPHPRNPRAPRQSAGCIKIIGFDDE